MDDILKNLEKWQKLNQWQTIIEHLRPMVEQGVRDPDILSALGFAYSQLDHYDEARYCYKLWIEAEPDRAQPYYNLGFTFYDAGLWSEAIEWFDLALERFPDYLVCLYRKGVALFLSDKPTKATETLKKAVRVYRSATNPGFKQRQSKYFYRSIFYLGKSYVRMRSYRKARACFEKILAEDRRRYIDPLFVRYNLAQSLLYLGELALAEQIASELTRIKPRAEWLFDFWGRVLIALKRYDQAIAALDRAVKIRAIPYIFFDRAKAHYLNGQKAQAKSDLHEALKRDRKGKHKILLELAKIAFAEKDFSRAMVFAQRAMEFKRRKYDVDYIPAHLLLSEIYKARGQDEKAQQELELAHNLSKDLVWEEALQRKALTIFA